MVPRSLPVLGLLAAACAPWPDGNLHLVVPDLDPAAAGEVTLIVGPSGRVVLLDAGNDRHAVEIAALLERATGARHVDDLVLTGYSGARLGGLDDLLDPASEDALEVARVITRGPFDLDADADLGEYRDLCAPLEASGAALLELCVGEVAPPCEGSSDPIPASSCPGLAWGDLDLEGDEGAPTFLDLGAGARLELLAAGGFSAAGALVVEGAALPGTGLVEGGRSVVLAARWGDFGWLRAGDAGGNPALGPDLEGALVEAGLVPAVRLLQVDRQGCAEASGATFLDAALDATTSALIGGSGARAGCPAQEVVDRIGVRLEEGSLWASSAGAGGAEDGLTLCDQRGGIEDLEVTVTPDGAHTVACVPGRGRAR